jgi:sugar-specific transcriptional regulator TrmB
MNPQLLQDLGLTKPQALAYVALVRTGGETAPAVATAINETRTNAYKLLDRLCELGLASKDQTAGKLRYLPASPAALEHILQKQREETQLKERKLKAEMPEMLSFFFAHTEQPSIRYFQGKEGVQQIFGDMLQTGRDIYLLRSPEDVHFYDETFFAEFRKKRSVLGITTHALTVDVPSAVHDSTIDLKNKFMRTWLPADAYTAPVEWDIYGNKVAIISYGKEAMGIIIESAQIAESLRQVFQLLAGSKDIANMALASRRSAGDGA